jgi:hypothetical protein
MPLLADAVIADHFPSAAHHEKGGCSPASPEFAYAPPPLLFFSNLADSFTFVAVMHLRKSAEVVP